MKTSWTCPTCGTEKGDCESAHGTPPPGCQHEFALDRIRWREVNGEPRIETFYTCKLCGISEHQPKENAA